MIKWVTVTDLQLRLSEKYGVTNPETGLNTRLERKLKNLSKAVDFAVSNKVTAFVALGDMVDRINPPDRLRGLFINELVPLFKHQIPVINLVGNHDTNFEVNALESEATTSDGRFDVISKITGIGLGEGLKILAIPWRPANEIEDCLTDLKVDKYNNCNVLFGHFAVDGAEIGPHEFKFPGGISPHLLKQFELVQLGHYHKRQNYYVGSLSRDDFSERGEPKGFSYVKWEGPGKWEEQFIDVEDQDFVQIEVSESGEVNIEGLQGKSLKEAVVKPVFTGQVDINTLELDDIRRFLLEQGASRVLSPEFSGGIRRTELRNPKVSESTTFESAMEDFVKEKVKKDGKRVMDLGLRILKAVTTGEELQDV